MDQRGGGGEADRQPPLAGGEPQTEGHVGLAGLKSRQPFDDAARRTEEPRRIERATGGIDGRVPSTGTVDQRGPARDGLDGLELDRTPARDDSRGLDLPDGTGPGRPATGRPGGRPGAGRRRVRPDSAGRTESNVQRVVDTGRATVEETPDPDRTPADSETERSYGGVAEFEQFERFPTRDDSRYPGGHRLEEFPEFERTPGEVPRDEPPPPPERFPPPPPPERETFEEPPPPEREGFPPPEDPPREEPPPEREEEPERADPLRRELPRTELPRDEIIRDEPTAAEQVRPQDPGADDSPERPPQPAPRPPGSYPRAIAHNEQVEYSYDPETGEFHARIVDSTSPVVTRWDDSPPELSERPVGTWDVTPTANGVQAEQTGRSVVPEGVKGPTETAGGTDRRACHQHRDAVLPT